VFPTYLIFDPLFLACFAYAMWNGGAPERIGAAIFCAGVLLTLLEFPGVAAGFRTVETGIFVVDIVTLVAFLILALRAERFWPLWMAAFQALGTAGHLVKILDPVQMRWGYAFLIAIWSYPMLLVLALGTWRHRQRLARLGVDKSWSTFRW
jgi:hypothetical protein